MKRIRKELYQVFTVEGRKCDLLHDCSRLADYVEFADQWMGGTDFVVSIGTDHHQVLHIRPGQQILKQIQGRRVEPLQIVEEQRERMVGPGEDVDEPPEHQLEEALRLL